MRKVICSLVACVIVVLLTWCSTGHSQQLPPQTGVETPEQKIEKLSPEERKRFINFLQKMGIPFNLPEFWTNVKDPKIAVVAATRFGEPLRPEAIAAFERLLPLSKKDTPQELFLAAFLYRYGKQAGLEVLMRRVKDQADETAAAILALNHESQALDGIAAILEHQPDLESVSLALALGSWDNTQVKEALLKAFKKAPENINLAMALSRLHVKEALPYALRTYHHRAMTTKLSKFLLAAALINLESPDSESLLTYLLQQVNDNAEDGTRFYAVQALGQIQNVKAEQALLQVINQCAASPNSVVGAYEHDVTLAAVEALSDNPSQLVAQSLLALFNRLQQNKGDRTFQSQVGEALIKIDDDAYVTVLRPVMGEKWLQDRLYLHHLKPLPAVFSLAATLVG